jgi:hypothetical protein
MVAAAGAWGLGACGVTVEVVMVVTDLVVFSDPVESEGTQA